MTNIAKMKSEERDCTNMFLNFRKGEGQTMKNILQTNSTSHSFSSITMKIGLYVTFLNVVFLTWERTDSAQLSAPSLVEAEEDGLVKISCNYSPRYRDYTKYWCRGPIYELCKIVVKTSGPRVMDRSSITEDKDSGVFTVIINSFKQNDQDKYWCVIAKSGRNIFTGINLCISKPRVLHVTEEASTAISTVTLTGKKETCLWDILRWIIFILLLGCFMTIHYWRTISLRFNIFFANYFL